MSLRLAIRRHKDLVHLILILRLVESQIFDAERAVRARLISIQEVVALILVHEVVVFGAGLLIIFLFHLVQGILKILVFFALGEILQKINLALQRVYLA